MFDESPTQVTREEFLNWVNGSIDELNQANEDVAKEIEEDMLVL